MNPVNETIVSPAMLKALKDASLDAGYEPVPKELEAKARQLLGGKALASMDSDMKRKARNLRKRKKRAGVAGY
jgi:PIN domain nuclease of toxin-antitoxin system